MAIIPQPTMNYTNLRLRIHRAGYEGTTLANRIGVPARTLTGWLSNGRPMPADVVARIATALQMTPDEIAEDCLGLRIESKEMSAEDVLAGFAQLLRRFEA